MVIQMPFERLRTHECTPRACLICREVFTPVREHMREHRLWERRWAS
jgi:hypothetical protein